MMNRALSLLVLLALTTNVIAGPVTVMVLPIDGTADATLRASLTTVVERAARTGDGTITSGVTTFAETAAAVGCDPTTPACAESVRATLAVDELIYGTATTTDGQTTIVVRKKIKDKDPEEVTVKLAATDTADKLEPIVAPLVGKGIVCPGNATVGLDGKCTENQLPIPVRHSRPDRNLAIAAAVGAGVMVLGGLGMWSSASAKQNEIDAAPTPMTSADFDSLSKKEDTAASRALFGNLLMLGGIGLGVVTYYLWKRDRKSQRDTVIVAPTPVPGGAGVWIRITR